MTDFPFSPDMETLLPCPFCGPGQSMVDPWFDDVSKRWAIGCGRCGASSGRSVHAEGSKEAAIKSWNTRGFAQTPVRPGKLTSDQIMQVIRRVTKGDLYEMLTCKRWKDGIDIDQPTFAAEMLAEEFRAAVADTSTVREGE